MVRTMVVIGWVHSRALPNAQGIGPVRPIRYALTSLSAPVRLSWFFNFCVFLCSPGRGMAEATADPDFTPIITIDILVQAGRYPIDLKQGHLENAFVCPCIFLLFFYRYLFIKE